MLAGTYRSRFSAADRRREAQSILESHPGRVPIIAEVAPEARDAFPATTRHKYLVPRDMTVATFMTVLRGRMQLPRDRAMFIFFRTARGGTRLAVAGEMLAAVYERDQCPEDGFLYCVYCSESTFGATSGKS